MEQFSQGMSAGSTFMYIVLFILTCVGFWKLFEKAEVPGWMAFIPILNMLYIIKIAGKPMWWILLLCVPILNIVVGISIFIGLAKNFGKGIGFAIGLTFFPFVFAIILGLSDAEYKKVA